ncbi:MAG TPA: LysM peptidoglycan-binding domain-containing protein [Dehalococcoidia bacterium]|jgi:nucleoid-associated protein YgaU|nr:LysM peptidoglycan-binding domain-containing protein [Dehalococcoidia bacterium]
MGDETRWVVDQAGKIYELPQEVLAQHEASPERIAQIATQARSSFNADTEVQGYYLRGYQVRPGDSLWAISQRLYGDGSLWPLLYAANSDKIRNPNLIYTGEVLRVF